eukprot:9303114-Alexandrium_andersonii.AAC.1
MGRAGWAWCRALSAKSELLCEWPSSASCVLFPFWRLWVCMFAFAVAAARCDRPRSQAAGRGARANEGGRRAANGVAHRRRER